ncbi:prepilin peptidase [Candidatus Poribacteria bacterium]|nr:prepilin peptidase [Candidatus Poribacteria bacterium]
MFSYETALAVLVLCFCAYASYTDLKRQKIPNFCSFGLLYVGILAQGIAFYKGALTLSGVLTNILVGGVVFIALYWFGVLAPGDVKLLWGASLALPITLFQQESVTLFPPLVVALNVFVVYLGLATLYLFLKTSFAEKKQALFGMVRLKNLPQRVLEFSGFFAFAFLFSWILPYFSNFSRLQVVGFLRLVLILIGFQLYRKGMDGIRAGNFQYFLLFALAGIVMFWSPSFSLPTRDIWRFLMVYFVFYVLFTAFLLQLGSFRFDREVSIEELTSEMVPAEEIVMIENPDGEMTYEKKPALMSAGLGANVLLPLGTTVLTAHKIDELKELAAAGKFENFNNRLRIQQAISFAPIILLGVILTIVRKGLFY